MIVKESPTKTVTGPEVSITPRDVDFELDPARATNWLDNSAEKTLFLNALSILFPPGERFFIASVLQNRGKVSDPLLKDEIKAFCQQEAYHTREHVAYNKALRTFVDSDKLDRELTEFLALVKKRTPAGEPLLVTCALEHFTAILAHAVLENPNDLAGSDLAYKQMWTWHALEECEHKAVAFDVFRTVAHGPIAEIRRCTVMVVTTIIFYGFIGKHVLALMKAQGMIGKPASWAKLLWYMFGNPGIMRRIAIPWARYFKPGFHPNDIDDTAALTRTRKLVATWGTN
jgi:predicted metal-dependent hydrolase